MKFLSKYSMGVTAAIITSMGLIAGLSDGNEVKVSIIASLLIIAIADNISDSLGLHIYKESEGSNKKEIARSTFGNFFARLLLVATFVLIVVAFSAQVAMIVASVWGLFVLGALSYSIAKEKKTSPVKEIIWHLFVALLVIIGSRLLGNFIKAHV